MNQSEIISPLLDPKAAGLEKVEIRLDQAYRPDGQPISDGVRNGRRVRRPETRQDRERVFQIKTAKLGLNDCWLWTGKSTNPQGYGRFYWGCRQVQCHRVAYFLAYGIDPFPFLVLHTCDVRLCLNPAHLFLGTDKTNAEDGDLKRRRIYRYGEQCGAAKLTACQVVKILSMRGRSLKSVAEIFNVAPITIAKIWTGRSWSKITGLPWKASHSRANGSPSKNRQ